MKKKLPNPLYCSFLLFLLVTLPACRKAEQPISQSRPITPARQTLLKQAPMLARQVEAGTLPPLSQRLPQTPKVVIPRQPGKYCDTWRISGNGLSSLTGAVHCFSYASLLHWSMDWNSWEAGLAERYEILDGGRTFRFHLRPGHKWSDGHPFTTDDIDFALTEVLGNARLHSNPPRFLKQDGVLAEYTRLSDTCFQFTFPEPNGMFLLDMVAAGEWMLFPKHYLTQFMPPYISETAADSIAQNAGFESWEQYFVAVLQLGTRNPELPTLRPWRLITPRGKENQKWELLRNPYYHVIDPDGRQLPYFDRIVGKNSSNEETVTLDIVTGKVDFQIRSVVPRNIPYYVANQKRGDYVVEFYPRKFSMGLFYNMQKKNDPVGRELMALRPFRKALSMAINRDEINKLLNWGLENPLYDAAIVERFRNDRELQEWFEYYPERANAILDSLGLERGSDSIRKRPDGQPLAITVFAIDSGDNDYLEFVKEYWHDCGIILNLKIKSYRSWWSYACAGEFDVVAYSVGIGPDLQMLVSASHVMPTGDITYWAGDWGLWYQYQGKAGIEPPAEIKQLYRLHEKAAKTLDPAAQMELLEELAYRGLKIGAVTMVKKFPPTPLIRKTNFRNVGKGNYYANWIRRSPSPDFPETFFLE